MKIVGKLFGLENDSVNFILEEDNLTLITETGYVYSPKDTNQYYDLIYGKTNDNKNIIFYQTNYIRKSLITYYGWAIWSGNVNPDEIKSFDVISFSGKCLDLFYSPQNAFK